MKPPSPLKILFAASEAQPLIKTGGLADVAGSLPVELQQLNNDVRLVLPAYPQAVDRAAPLETVATLHLPETTEPVRLLEGRLGGQLPVYLVDIPGFFDRPGNPYTDDSGKNWSDNAQRFALFSRIIVTIAMNRAKLGWRPDIVHCNDWQTGLIPALLAHERNRPSTLFTIHNLAYQGIFDRPTFDQLKLPPNLWSPEGLEFHQHLSFIKGGLVFSDRLTTVSPTYAEEICTPQFGYGLEGLLKHRKEHLSGVLNGIDYQVWDPSSNPNISQHYNAHTFHLKQTNKLRLQKELGLRESKDSFLIGHIGRVVEQKGTDLILEVLPDLMQEENLQMVLLGKGDTKLEQMLLDVAHHYPGRVVIHIGYDEKLAHQIEASCDCFLMPSRFEPCGLNQLYSLRYGTVPVVHHTGGLADTVVDVTASSILRGNATGFVFDHPDKKALLEATGRAINYYNRPGVWWKKLATNGMKQDFSWTNSARRYLELYHQAMDDPTPNPVA